VVKKRLHMQFPDKQYPHSDITGDIIKAAQTLHGTLKNGLTEKIYENALCLELAAHNIPFSQQHSFIVNYRNKPVGKLIPDLIVQDKVIVETKVVEQFTNSHYSQILSYLKISQLKVGLLLNFKHKSLQIKRIANLDA